MSLLIKNALHCFKNTTQDIFVENGKITKVADSIEQSAEKIIDASGKILYPAFANMHTHAAMTLFRGYADDLKLMEWLNTKIWPVEMKMTEEDVYAGTKLACLEMIKTGTTLFNDMYWHFDAIYQATEESGMRAMLSAVMIDMFDSKRQKSNEKRTLDIFDSYFNKNDMIQVILGPHAVYTVSENGLRFAADLAREKETFLHIHLSETLKEVEDCIKLTGKRPPNYLDSLGFMTDKTLCAHSVWLNSDEIDLMAGKQSKTIHVPVSNMKLSVGGVMPMKQLQENNVTVIIGTDGSASNNNLDMIEEMKIASLLQKWKNSEADCPTANTVLNMSHDGFRILGLSVGDLKEGDDADFILLKSHPTMIPLHNPVSNLIYAGSGCLVDTTVCNGNVLMENGYVEGEEKIIEQALKTVKKMF